MSQRGKFVQRTNKFYPTGWWGYLRSVVALTVLFTLGCTLILVAAEDSQNPKTVTLQIDGTTRQIMTMKATVQTVLHQEHISLLGHDRTEPVLESPIVDGMTIVVYRVVCKIEKRRVEIPAPTVTRYDARMPLASVEIQQGRPGIALETHVLWTKDGVISTQWVQNSRVIRRPKPKVILRGSQQPSRSTMERRVVTMVATAYDPGPLSCGPRCTGRTALGLKAQKGMVAVDPRVIPLGTRLFIDGYGPALAADTGGAIKGNRIDLCFNTRGEALNWGRRSVRVVIMN